MNKFVLGRRTPAKTVSATIRNDGYIYYHSENKRRKATETKCASCKTVIYHDARKPGVWFCSALCYRVHNGHYINCDHCGKSIIRVTSKQGKLNFCNRDCKEKEQGVGGLIELPHYKDGLSDYRSRAIAHYGQKCNDCEETINHRLVVHHIDSDRRNNDINNLLVLCHNHHSDRHTSIVDDRVVLKYNTLT